MRDEVRGGGGGLTWCVCVCVVPRGKTRLFVFPVADWDCGATPGDSLLETACRCSLAVLLKHTGLQDEAYWQDK